MNVDEIRQLIEMMKANQIGEIDWESKEGEHIRIQAQTPGTPPAAAYPPEPQPPQAPIPAPEAAAPEEPEDAGIVIKSPIVGTFYRAPAPEKPVFVATGDRINPETVVCIIEAMKVMNEIKAETNGVLREVLVENGQPVEFGQPLFVLEPA